LEQSRLFLSVSQFIGINGDAKSAMKSKNGVTVN